MGYSNEMVAHIWAQQGKKTEAHSSNGNFYFRGSRIYSYGSHYVAGMIDKQGRAWLNSRGYSPTTASKHLPPTRRAVSHRVCLYVPDLTEIVDAIERPDPRTLRRYLVANARTLSDDAGAAIYALFSRGDWAKFKARELGKAAKLSEQNKRRLRMHDRKRAAVIAATPMKIWRAKAMSLLDSYGTSRRLVDEIRDVSDAHKAAGSPRIKAAVWQRLKLLRAIRADEARYRGKLEARQSVAQLRRLLAGESADQLRAGCGQSSLWFALAGYFLNPLTFCHMPPATRAALLAMESQARSIGTILRAREDAKTARASERHELKRSVTAWRRIVQFVGDRETHAGFALDRPASLEQIERAALALSAAPLPAATRQYLAETAQWASDVRISIIAQHDLARAQRLAMSLPERLAAWRSGENGWHEFRDMSADAHGGAYIRARNAVLDGCRVVSGDLETSQGATVPLRHAVAVFGFVRAKRLGDDNPLPVWTRSNDGPRAGHFTIDTVWSDGSFRAGCHVIRWAQIESLARELGVWDCDAAALESEVADVA